MHEQNHMENYFGYKGGTMFCVFDTGFLGKKHLEVFLANLPFQFSCRALGKDEDPDPRPQIYVNKNCPIIRVYQPSKMKFSYVNLAQLSDDIRKQIYLYNFMDDDADIGHNIRTCFHFRPEILGVSEWKPEKWDNEIELIIFKYPKEFRS